MKRKLLLLNPPGDKKYFRDYFCTNVSKARYYFHPLDLVYASGWLDPYFELFLIDAIADSLSDKECIKKIKEICPEVIVFLLSAPSFEIDLRFLSKLNKMLPNAKMIGSGDIYREVRERAFKIQPYLDAIFLDFSTPDLISYLIKKDKKPINNLLYKEGKTIIEGPEIHGYGAFRMPVPRWDLFHLDNYSFPFALKTKLATILTDFGCPFKCSFCPMSGVGFKLREIENVIEELKLLKKLGVNELFFKDQTFGANKKRTKRLLERIKEEKLDFSWTCYSRVDVIDEPLLRIMKPAGCHTVIFGIESMNEGILEKYSKNTTEEEIINALNLSKKAGIRTAATFIIGLPGETKESTERTISFAKKLPIDFASFNIATPRFGTRFRKNAVQEGIIDAQNLELDSSESQPKWKNQTMSNEDICKLQRKAYREFYLRPAYLIKRLLHIKTFFELKQSILEAKDLLFK